MQAGKAWLGPGLIEILSIPCRRSGYGIFILCLFARTGNLENTGNYNKTVVVIKDKRCWTMHVLLSTLYIKATLPYIVNLKKNCNFVQKSTDRRLIVKSA